MSEADILKQKILAASRILYAPNGITNVQTDFSGHVSGRLPGQENYYIVGHIHQEGRPNLEAGYDDLINVSVRTGKKIDGQYPAVQESVIHTAIYRARNDVNSIVHAHPFWCTVWSLTDRLVLGLPVLSTKKFLVSSEQQGEDLVKTLGDGRLVLLPGHGLVAVGKNVEQACTLTALTEEYAQMIFNASLLGEVSKKHVRILREKAEAGEMMWLWYEVQLKGKGKYPDLPFG